MFSIEEKNNISIPIVRKISNYDYSDRPLFQFHMEKHPVNKPNYFSCISLELASIEIILYLAAMKRLLLYFRVS
jgi:vacuolar protein sorting-associated protein 13A/C